jgi:hypothetical protein
MLVVLLSPLERNSFLNYASLKEKHRKLRNNFEQDFSIRLHRSLSWLERGEKEVEDPDAGFIFYWISFNSNYSMNFTGEQNTSETGKFYNFFSMIVDCDKEKKIFQLVWNRFSNEIRSTLNNEFIFRDFWETEKGDYSWKQAMEESRATVNKALRFQNTVVILQILFSRLYVLRNQLIHGNATWKGSKNREQVINGFKLISNFQPLFLSIMMNNPDKNWGLLAYPIISEDY